MSVCVKCKQEEYYWHKGIKFIFKPHKGRDFVCSKCSLTMATTPRKVGKRIPMDLEAQIKELENLLSAGS